MFKINKIEGFKSKSLLDTVWNTFQRGRVMSILFFLTIIPYFILSYYVTPAADDFSYAHVGRSGIFKVQQRYYRTWTGRYTTTLIQTTPTILGNYIKTYKYYPFALLTLTFLSLWMFFSALFRRRIFVFSAILPTLFAMTLYINSMPSVMEGFYWLSGAYTYQFPMCIGFFVLSLLFLPQPKKNMSRIFQYSLILIMSFLTVGCSEIVAYIFICLLFLGCFATFFSNSPRAWSWRIAFFVACIGFLIVVNAPGNVARSACFPNKHNLGLSLELAFFRMVFLLKNSLLSPLLWSGSLLSFPFLGIISRRYSLETLSLKLKGLIFSYLFLVFLGSVFIPCWAMGSELPLRTANPQWFFLLGLIFSSLLLVYPHISKKYWFFKRKSPRFLLVSIICIFSLGGTGNFPNAFADLSIAHEYKKQWEKRYTIIEKAHEINAMKICLPPINYPYDPQTIAYYDITLNPKHFTNGALATYFGLEGVVLEVPKELLNKNYKKHKK